MCHKCEEQNNLHLSYLKHRGIEAIGPLLASPTLYSLFIQRATLNSKALLAKIENGGSGVTGEDISCFSVVVEKKALDFAQHHLGKIHLEKDALVAKTIEHLVAALTLVQSKAIMIGSDAIALDAGDALDAYHTKHYRFGQSSKELQAMLDEHK